MAAALATGPAGVATGPAGGADADELLGDVLAWVAAPLEAVVTELRALVFVREDGSRWLLQQLAGDSAEARESR